MNKDSILLFTKDALSIDYLPIYGNQYWKGKTPNMDELVEKGTLFTRFYTAAPSSSMAYLSMFTGKYPYEQDIMTYTPLLKSFNGQTLFDKAKDLGFSTHVIWDEIWMRTSYLHSRCYGVDTKIHALEGLRQGVGFHYHHDGFLIPNKEKELQTLDLLENKIKEIVRTNDKVFVWLHLPHVINGRVGYGTDIDLYDIILGIMRKYFDDSRIYISADHGNMNGHKGKLGYGFDVYEHSIRIPLITPRKEGLKICDSLVSNIDWKTIIFEDYIPVRDIILSDTAYYAQPNRKVAIIYENYRYIYNKADSSEELYDIGWDPNQNFNLINDQTYDSDRKVTNISRELFFYPFWDKLPEIRIKLRKEKNIIWKDVSVFQNAIIITLTWLKKNKITHSLLKMAKKMFVK